VQPEQPIDSGQQPTIAAPGRDNLMRLIAGPPERQ